MANFGGSVRNDDFGKSIGVFEADVVSINPDREEMEKVLKIPVEKDPEYLGEKDGNTTLRVSVWLKEKRTGKLFNAPFFLQDKKVVSKKGLIQYINEKGQSRYVADKNDLPENFVKSTYRQASTGEAEFVGFLDAWMKLNKKDAFNLLPDWKKLMKGNLDEIVGIMKTDLPRSIGAMAYVRVVEKEGELKEYQAVYTRKLVAGYVVKDIVGTKWTPEKIADLVTKKMAPAVEGKKIFLKSHEDFVVTIADEEYGLKDPNYLGSLKDYDKNEFPEVYAKAGSPREVAITEGDDSEY